MWQLRSSRCISPWASGFVCRSRPREGCAGENWQGGSEDYSWKGTWRKLWCMFQFYFLTLWARSWADCHSIDKKSVKVTFSYSRHLVYMLRWSVAAGARGAISLSLLKALTSPLATWETSFPYRIFYIALNFVFGYKLHFSQGDVSPFLDLSPVIVLIRSPVHRER